jgi:hypothetical protein
MGSDKPKTIKLDGLLKRSAYCEVKELPPHTVQIEIEVSDLHRQIQKQLLTFPPVNPAKKNDAKRTISIRNKGAGR